MIIFRAFTFSGKKSARKAFDDIEDVIYDYDWYVEENVAEISVNKRGSHRIHSTWAQDSSNVPGGLGLGAILGGFIGFLFGPAGAMAGAAVGGGIGGMIGHHENVKFDDPALDDFADSLLPDSSALIYIGDSEAVVAFEAALADYNFATFDKELDQAEIDNLQALMNR